MKGVLRYTPGGTQVPEGTPPENEGVRNPGAELPPVPPWPLESYAKEEAQETFRWLTPKSPRIGLHGGIPEGGMNSRHGRARDGGDPRHGLWHGGIDSRQGQVRGDGSFFLPEGGEGAVTASEARAFWMERVVAGLRQKLESMEKVGWTAAYWNNPAVGASDLPGGVRAVGTCASDLPGGVRAVGTCASDLPGGVRAVGTCASDLPGGVRAVGTCASDLPGGVRAVGTCASDLPGGVRAVGTCASDLQGGVRAVGNCTSELPGGVRAVSTGKSGLPGEDRALREGVFDLFGEAPAEVEGTRVNLDREGARDRVGGSGELQQTTAEAEEKDTLKATTVVLPSLPSVAGKDAGLACGDWLAQVRPLMGDIAVGALTWWDCVVAAVTTQYYRWLEASPLDRLRIAAPDPSVYNTTPSRQRMELRASAIILAALPGSLKDEVISSRQLATGELLYKILRVYQPGGVQERADTLSALTGEQVAKTPKEAVDRLRRWRRHQLRAIELRASLPDPSLMIRSLSRLVETLLGQAPQALFRVNSYRLQSKLDVMPSEANLEAYYDLLISSRFILTRKGKQFLCMLTRCNTTRIALCRGCFIKVRKCHPRESFD